MRHGSHHDNAKAVISLFIVLLAFGIFLLFYTNSEEIIRTNKFFSFMTFSTIAMGLMVGLLFLVNNSKEKTHKAHAVKGGKSKKTKKA